MHLRNAMQLPVHRRAALRFLRALVWTLLACTLPVGAQVQSERVLPDHAWRLLEGAPGVRWTGPTGARANVQVVCDANCPHCARLDTVLREDWPGLAVRWIPVAYFTPESEAMAASILAAPDASGALHDNYRGYDHRRRRGGHVATDAAGRLGRELSVVRSQWERWGGFTPMVVVRTGDGRIIQAMGSHGPLLESALQQAAPPGRRYESWKGGRQ